MGASDGAMKRSIEYQGRQLKRLRNNGTKRKSETFNEKPSTVEDDRDSFAAGSMVASLGEKIVSTCNTTKRRAGSAQHFCSWSTRRHCSQRGPAQAQGFGRSGHLRRMKGVVHQAESQCATGQWARERKGGKGEREEKVRRRRGEGDACFIDGMADGQGGKSGQYGR